MEVARLLLDSGAQVNMPADSFESPLTLAACGGHVELAALLIERGANLEEVCEEMILKCQQKFGIDNKIQERVHFPVVFLDLCLSMMHCVAVNQFLNFTHTVGENGLQPFESHTPMILLGSILLNVI